MQMKKMEGSQHPRGGRARAQQGSPDESEDESLLPRPLGC